MATNPIIHPDITLIREAQNELVFSVKDIDRKPVALPDDDVLTMHIIDIPSDTLLLQRDLTVQNLAKGVYQVIIFPADVKTWPTGPYRWNLVKRHLGKTMMMWTDLYYTPSGPLYVTEPNVEFELPINC